MSYRRYVYKLTFPNGMVYIGSTNDVKTRWAGKGVHYRGMYVGQFIEKFGWDNIEKDVVLKFSDRSYESNKNVCRVERELIHAYGDRCYNRQGNKEFHTELAGRMRVEGRSKPLELWTINGITKPARDFCTEMGISRSKIERRMRLYDLSLGEALALPDVPKNRTRDPIKYWKELGFDVKKRSA